MANFKPPEFARKARPPKFPTAAEYPKAWVTSRLQRLIDTLEAIRHELGDKAIKVNSGFRDAEYNASLGSKSTSQHVQGRAADITVAGVPPARVHAVILKMYAEGRLPYLGGLGIYPTFVHVDVRIGKKLARWSGSRKDN